MTKKLILAAAMLLTGSAAVAAQPKVISHRGYWTAPNSAQNSLASFTKADSVGVFGSEIDVWLTADDKLIVNHDRVYKGTDINMEKSTLKEITSIVLPNGENIPTLDAYLRLVATKPNTRLILEMKSLSDLKREDLATEKIVKALRKYNLLDRTDIIAFSINACLAFKKLMPDGRIFYLNGDLAPRSIKKLGLTGIDYSMSVLRKNPKWVEQAHKEGLEVNVWTVDTEEDTMVAFYLTGAVRENRTAPVLRANFQPVRLIRHSASTIPFAAYRADVLQKSFRTSLRIPLHRDWQP